MEMSQLNDYIYKLTRTRIKLKMEEHNLLLEANPTHGFYNVKLELSQNSKIKQNIAFVLLQ
jgi:hypothetical protein